MKESQIFQVKEFSPFLCMGRCKSLDSGKSFLSYAAHYPAFFLHPEFLSVYYREWLQPEICQITQVFFSFLSAPRAQRFKDLEG